MIIGNMENTRPFGKSTGLFFWLWLAIIRVDVLYVNLKKVCNELTLCESY